MKNEHLSDSIPAPVQELMTIFKDHLASVAFPDVSLEVLASMAEKVSCNAREVQEALTRAESAQEALEASRSELQQKAMRAIAYARVFAEGNAALTEKLAALSFGKAPRAPRKAQGQSAAETESPSEAPAGTGEKAADKKAPKPEAPSERR